MAPPSRGLAAGDTLTRPIIVSSDNRAGWEMEEGAHRP